MRRRLDPGEWAAIGLLSGGLSVSAALVAAGYEPTSTCVRRSTLARAVVLVLAAHLCLELDHDPLTWLGHRIEAACRRVGLHQPLAPRPRMASRAGASSRPDGHTNCPMIDAASSSRAAITWA